VSLEETVEARRETALRLMKATTERDRDSVSSCLSKDAIWWIPQSSSTNGNIERPLRGREAVVELLCGETRFFEVGTLRWEFQHVLSDNDFVLVHGTLRATTSSGRDYENQYVMLHRFDDRLVAEVWEHLDTAYAYSRFAD
jgi:ketosteroid isomerase-like protein